MRTFLLLFVALGAAGLAAFGAQSWLSAERSALSSRADNAENSSAEQRLQGPQILVAISTIETGQFVTKSMMEWKYWPEKSLNDAYIVKSDKAFAYDGAVATQRISAGQPVSPNLLVHPGQRGFLAAVLKPGMRAVSLPVDATRGISGLVFPGDHVDLILSRALEQLEGSGRFLSQTVLSDVRILAVDQDLDSIKVSASKAKQTTNKINRPRSAKTVTVEVKPKQAEKVALALKMGTLSLSLRSVASDTSQTAEGYTADNVFPGPEKQQAQREFPVETPVETPIRRTTTRVTVTRGNPAG